MNLFISWSEERSGTVAKTLHPWIKCILQNIDPFFSPSDIAGGSIWISKLNNKLAASNAGIICLTPENQHNPWIQFEAGALAKGLDENRVFVLLIGMETHEVSGPLSSFNHTPSTKAGIQKMVFDLNELLVENKLPDEIIKRVFEKNYSDLEEILIPVIKTKPDHKKEKKRDSNDMQIEMLELLRGLSKRVSRVESFSNDLINSRNSEIIYKSTSGRDVNLSKDNDDSSLTRLFDSARNEGLMRHATKVSEIFKDDPKK